MVIKSREEIEGEVIVASVKSKHKDSKSYLKSIGWGGSLKDYVDVKHVSQKKPWFSYFFIFIFIIVGFMGLMILGVNVTGNAIETQASSSANNSFIGLFLFLIGLIGLIFRIKN